MNRKTKQWIAVLSLLAILPHPARGACCYFAAKDKDVNQPAQKAFITWNPEKKAETFTVQPKFEGNAGDFGMVVPTPSQPKLAEMPREFFKHLAVFSILEPMDMSKYKSIMFNRRGPSAVFDGREMRERGSVKILEAGIVGSLDYKIITAERADDLFSWLKEHEYQYGGDEATLDFYIRKKWFFTVMKIDPKQMKPRADGTYEGQVTPTRFSFTSDKLIYPLKITSLSVKDQTEALFYVQAPKKMDLPGSGSYHYTWQPMWANATGFAIPEKLSEEEKAWQKHVQGKVQEAQSDANNLREEGQIPATLEWAKEITQKDLDILSGKAPYNRDAPKEDVEKLKNLKGHVEKGQFITKMRKVFVKAEMVDDLVFERASFGGREDDIEYYSILPTSPP